MTYLHAALVTALSFLLITGIFIMLINEEKIIAFEDKMFRFIKFLIADRKREKEYARIRETRDFKLVEVDKSKKRFDDGAKRTA